MEIQEVREFYDNWVDYLKDEKPRHQWVFKSIDRFIPSDCRVLDLGCGTGITSAYLAKGGRKVTGVDLSPELIRYAKTYNSHFNFVDYIVGDISNIEGLGKFDAIMMVDVLEHIFTDSLTPLFNRLSELSHDRTVIYLNIPHGNVLRFLQKNCPEDLQIVDNPIKTGKILKMFSMIDFVPFYFQFYWNQYVEYLFITKKEQEKLFKKIFIKE